MYISVDSRSNGSYRTNKSLRGEDEMVHMGLNLHVHVLGHFLLAVQP